MNGGALACHVCTSTRLREVPFGYMYHDRWLGGVECRTCGIIFIHPQPTPEELQEMYSKEYFESDFRCGHAGSYFDEETLGRLGDKALLDRIRKVKPAGRFLEVGCAGGAFLNAAREAGYEVNGVEFSDDASRFARERFGLDITTGDVITAKFPADSFDIIFMGDVLEHLSHPVATVRELHRIMMPGGLLVVACPMQTNTVFSRGGFMLYRLFGKRATVHLPPYHVFEYRESSMKFLLERFGFSIHSLRQGIVSPGEIALRGSGVQNLGKKLFQYPNALLTSVFGVCGDRVEAFALKKGA